MTDSPDYFYEYDEVEKSYPVRYKKGELKGFDYGVYLFSCATENDAELAVELLKRLDKDVI